MNSARQLCWVPVLLTGCTLLIYLTPRSHLLEAIKGVRSSRLFPAPKWLHHTVDIYSDAGFDCDRDIRTSELNDEVTVVTAYFNIGSFAKGSRGLRFTPELYRKWMTSFALIDNPLVVFVDSADSLEYFRSIRRQFPSNRTRFILVSRSRMWTFSNETLSRVTAIFQQPGYPKSYPNTVVPEYSLAMHAKYETVQMAIRQNLFHSRYFCWLDIGLFRDIVSTSPSPVYSYSNGSNTSSTIPPPPLPSGQHFTLYLPPHFVGVADNDSIAVCEVVNRNPSLTPKQIVFNDKYWIGGGCFIGRANVMYRWAVEYLNGVRWMISEHLMSTDQQIIYSMFNAAHLGLRPYPRTKLKIYHSDRRFFDEWFYLAYLAREEGLRRAKQQQQQSMSLTTTRVIIR